MKSDVLALLTLEDLKEIVATADSLITHTAWDDITFPTEESYYKMIMDVLKVKAK